MGASVDGGAPQCSNDFTVKQGASTKNKKANKMKLSARTFSDVNSQLVSIRRQIEGINAAKTSTHIRAGGDPSFVPNLIDFEAARRALVNRVGKFYGMRSKYDGSGNLRTPMKASRFA